MKTRASDNSMSVWTQYISLASCGGQSVYVYAAGLLDTFFLYHLIFPI